MTHARKALVIGAHPDDCALGAGGFAVLLRQAGWQVIFLTMTNGELGGEPALRMEEERQSGDILGVHVDFGHLSDGSLSGRSTVQLLEQKLVEHKPDLILTHAPTDSHADHRVISDSLVSAARRYASVLFYEGPSTLGFSASLKIDIADAWDLKVKSLLAHASQRARVRTIEWAESVGRHRAWPHYNGVCEAFFPVRMNLNLMVEIIAPGAVAVALSPTPDQVNPPAAWRLS
jgi:LmbE family N-acetylglucosaminyl deacetylase